MLVGAEEIAHDALPAQRARGPFERTGVGELVVVVLEDLLLADEGLVLNFLELDHVGWLLMAKRCGSFDGNGCWTAG